MTLHRFLMWYLGAVLFVGTAGAGGYQILSRHHAQLAEREAAAQSPASGLPQAMAAAEPIAPGNNLPEAATFPAVNSPSRRAAASPAVLYPPLHSQLAGSTALRPHLATTGTSHVSQSYRLADQRHTTIARTTHRTVAQTVTLLRQAPPLPASQYAAFSQPAWMYAQPPAPSVRFYPYPGYPAYQPGYAYYYPRYQYYRPY